jgi:hypothetical protein
MALSKAGACLAVALLFAPARDGFARPAMQAPPPKTETQTTATPVTGAQSDPKQTQTTPPKTERKSRRTKRTPRTSARQPAAPTAGSFDENRTPRAAGPTRQELLLTANLMGGYDDNLTGGLGTGSTFSPSALASGPTASLDSTLDYFRGNARRSFRVDTSGNLVAYPGHVKGVVPGGAVDLGGSTILGRDQTLRVSERVGYEPLFTVFSPGASLTPLPPPIGGTVAATGLFERRSLSSNSSVTVDSRWSLRNWTSFTASYGAQNFTDSSYGDSTTWSAQADYRRGLSRGVRAHAGYRYVDAEYTDSEHAGLPTREHRIEVGPEIDKALSRRRHLTMSLGAGADRFESAGATTRARYHAWIPVGSASATLGLTPLWSVEGGYNRDLSRLRGLTDQVYTSDTAYVSTGGRVAPKTSLRLSGTYSTWKTPAVSGAADRLEVYGASLRVQVALTSMVAATADYSYYHQFYSNPGDLPAGFPATYNRQAVHVGLTLRAPLAGTPAPTPLSPR